MDPFGQVREKVRQTNLVLANLGDFKFTDATATAGTEFATKRATHRGAAFGDLDNDGRVDVLVTALDEGVELWRNVSPAPNHWLAVRTIGTKSNHDGIGARLSLTTPSGAHYSHVNTAVGYGGASDLRVHFGIGLDTAISKLEILWPSGIRQVLQQVPVDQALTLTEPAP